MLSDTFPIDAANVLPTVPGRFALASDDSQNGNVIERLRLPSCGGVEMAFPEGKVVRGRGDTSEAEFWGNMALQARARAGIGAKYWSLT